MERSSSIFVVNGGIRLPIGYRFRPTEEELLVHYLKRKAFGFPLPALIIPEFDVFTTDPWILPGDMKEKNRYFFSKGSTMGINGSGSGYWKPIGKEKKIVASSGTNQILGSRKSLAFYESKKKKKKTSHDHPHATKTRWIMHEYRLSIPPTTQMSEKKHEDDWSVYCVFQRKRKARRSHGSNLPCRCSWKKKQEEEEARKSVSSICRNSICIDFTVQDSSDHFGPPPPSSPSSINGATEDCFSEALDQEENSSTTAHQFFSFCTSN
ncbi:NAC domain-containing protein 83 [Carica papaya]|uniref:NAC domain-containing protein 83 n=1 Tax=Carica papaya TaxID=3649 RepID=UPI000B8CE5B1|nr:NAC domain-containing protein 83 [Carica papaya]